MLNAHRFLGMVFLALALVPSFSFAQGNAYRCNGCTSTQYINAAKAPQQLGVRFVYDFVNGNIRKFQVTREPNGNGFTYYADPLTVTVAEQTYFDMSATAWSANGSSLKAVAYVDVTPTFPGSSVLSPGASTYDIARFTSMQNNITDWLNGYSGQGFSQGIQSLIVVIRQSSANIVYEADDLAQLTLVLKLTTQHKITIVWKKGTLPVITKLVDGNNNTIPFPLSNANGQSYHLGGGDGQDGLRLNGFVNVLHGVYANVCGRTIVACVTYQGVINCEGFPACP